jgi:hypothetical protein
VARWLHDADAVRLSSSASQLVITALACACVASASGCKSSHQGEAGDNLTDAGRCTPETSDGGGPHVISEGAEGIENEAETQVAVAPDGTIGVAWMGKTHEGKATHVAYRFSRDGGVSWTPLRLAPVDMTTSSADASIVATSEGDFYIGFLAINVDVATQTASFRVQVGRVPKGSDEIAAFSEVGDPAMTAHWSLLTWRQNPYLIS